MALFQNFLFFITALATLCAAHSKSVKMSTIYTVACSQKCCKMLKLQSLRHVADQACCQECTNHVYAYIVAQIGMDRPPEAGNSRTTWPGHLQAPSNNTEVATAGKGIQIPFHRTLEAMGAIMTGVQALFSSCKSAKAGIRTATIRTQASSDSQHYMC